MSHEITKNDDVMLERSAWHRLGDVIGRAFNWREAEEAKHSITLRVNKVPLADILTTLPIGDDLSGPVLRALADQFANVREDGLILYSGGGVQHTVFHAKDGYEFGCAIRDEADTEANLLSAGTLRGGRQWFMTFDLGEFDVLGYIVKDYLSISGSYDASRKFKTVSSPTLVVCANTLAASDFGMKHWEFKHTSGIFDRVEAAKQALRVHRANRDGFVERCEALDGVRLSRADYSAMLNALLPVDDEQSTRTQNVNTEARQLVTQFFKGAPATTGELAVTDGQRTGFTLVQAVNTYEQWYKPLVNRSKLPKETALAYRQMDSILDGGVQPLTHKAIELVLS